MSDMVEDLLKKITGKDINDMPVDELNALPHDERRLIFITVVSKMAFDITCAMVLCTCAAHERLIDLEETQDEVLDIIKLWLAANIMVMHSDNKNEKMRELVIEVRNTTEKVLGVDK